MPDPQTTKLRCLSIACKVVTVPVMLLSFPIGALCGAIEAGFMGGRAAVITSQATWEAICSQKQ
jgi:hypothetical protein